MGQIREYLGAFWSAGRAAYSQGKAIWSLVIGAVSTAALLGFSWFSSLLPAWASGAWLCFYVAVSVLIYVPYRMWRKQRAEIAELMLPHGPVPDFPIRELFDLVRAVRKSDDTRTIGRAIMDKLSTGQVVGWGRPRGDKLSALVQIDQNYWSAVERTYSFYTDDKQDALEPGPHVGPLWNVWTDNRKYYDVYVSKAQALRIWQRAGKG